MLWMDMSIQRLPLLRTDDLAFKTDLEEFQQSKGRRLRPSGVNRRLYAAFRTRRGPVPRREPRHYGDSAFSP